MRGVPGQAQVRGQGHQEAGVLREDLLSDDDDGGGGEGPTAAAEVFQGGRRLHRGERGPHRESYKKTKVIIDPFSIDNYTSNYPLQIITTITIVFLALALFLIDL